MKYMLPRSHKGFTLIELLIVIALLGALAVGLIGAIDPFEQLKKGTDTGTRDLVSQVQTAIIRFYSVKSAFPAWTSTPNKTPVSDAIMTPAINDIIAAGELRSDFTTVQAAKLTKVFVTLDTVNNVVSVCYQPDSKSFQSDPNTKYDQDGTVWAGSPACISTSGGTKRCYWCIQ